MVAIATIIIFDFVQKVIAYVVLQFFFINQSDANW